MAELLVGPVIEKLIDTGFQYLKDQMRWQTGMKEELKRLRKNHPQIQAVVDYASSQEHIKEKNPALNEWLWQLRDAIDEADDVMDEFEYQKLKEQLILKMEKTKKRKFSSLSEIASKIRKVGQRFLKNETLKRLEEVMHKLDKVSADLDTFLQLAKEAKQDNQEQQLEFYEARETGSSRTNDLMGRGKQKEIVMKWLRNPSNIDSQTSNYSAITLYNNISLLSVVGQGGMGKTTLLQDIYKEEMIIDFDLKFWVCVSNNFNVTKVIADMLESLTNERPRLQTLDALQKNLESEVRNKKFLLVLDDIWEEEDEELNKSKWEKVLAPLAAGKLGSKILMTTRLESVVFMLSKVVNKKNEMLRLEGLKDDECLMLLNRYAFANVDNLNVHPNLRQIAENIVKKLSGSPLAARVIGGVLNSHLDETHWNKVLNYEIGSQKGILDILKLSYIFLPKVLRNCFSFCCTFPQDYWLDKDDLVQMWISLGFIQPDNTRGETIKEAGERYFDTLVQKSLFEKFQEEDETYYKLHDLLHEMLRTFSTQECFSIVGGEEELLSKTPKTIRHLFVENVNPVVLREVEKFKNLRSLILIYSETHEDLVDVLAKIFKKLRSIRLMHVNAKDLKQIPKEIEDLIHLQYLTIYCSTELPAPVSLPHFWRLPFLKYLYLYNMTEVKGFDYKFHGNDKVCVFPSLQVLHIKRLLAFEDWFVAKAAGYECLFPCLTELYLLGCSNLQELPAGLPPKLENLEIDNIGWKGSNWLQGISSYCTMSIQNCPNLISLKGHQEMETTEKCQLILSELVVNDPSLLLKVPLTSATSIQKLEIINNNEVISFSIDDVDEWFMKVCSSLCELKFRSLKSLQFLPSLESLSSLKILLVYNLPLLQLLPNMPASLKVLNLFYLESLQCLPSSLSFSFLEHLHLGSIPLLRNLPDLPPSLCELQLYNLSNLHCLPSCLPSCLPCLVSLKELHLVYLPLLSELPDLPPSLCKLQLHNLPNLHCLPSCLPCLFSLKELDLVYLPQLSELPNLPPSLYKLQLHNLSNLHCLPSCLPCLFSLKKLCLEYLPQLPELPDLPPSLSKLQLYNLSNLHCLPSCLPCLFSLKELYLECLPQLSELPDLPPSLCELQLIDLSNLLCLPSCLPCLFSLKELHLQHLPQFSEIPDLPPSLNELQIYDLSNLHCLPSCLPCFFSLKILRLYYLPQLSEIPDFPPSLKILDIWGCHPELMECYKRVTGSD